MKKVLFALLLVLSSGLAFGQHLPNLTVLENSGMNPNDGIICAGSNIILIAAKGASDQANPIFFSFNSGQSGVPNANGQFVVNVVPSVSFQYIVTVTYDDNQTGMALMDIVVNQMPSISVIMTPNNGPVCPGTLITATTSTSLCGAPVTTTFQAPASTTTYNYSTNNNGCIASTSATVNVTPLPTAAFSASITGNTVNFNNGSSGATSYTWNFGNGVTSNATNPSYGYPLPGTYNVTLTASNNCGNTTATLQVMIANPPTPSPCDQIWWDDNDHAITYNQVICLSDPLLWGTQITFKAPPGATDILWNAGAGGQDPTSAFHVVNIGVGLITLSLECKVNGVYHYYCWKWTIVNCATGTEDGFSENTGTSTLNVYPNPNNGKYINTDLVFAEPADAVLIVTDITGKILISEAHENITTETVYLVLPNLPNGIYVLHLVTKNGDSTKKFVVTSNE